LGVGTFDVGEDDDGEAIFLTTACPHEGQCFQFLSTSPPHFVQKAMLNFNHSYVDLED
jgi:hypothetical protein